MNNKKKKAFTLIELMIVLGVISILALVLIPRAGATKTNAKVVGVTSNVNAVRSFLELRTGSRFISDDKKLEAAIKGAFTGTESLKNPLNEKDETIIVSKSSDVEAVPGSVVVIINADNYELYGVDDTGSKIGDSIIIKK